MNPQKEKPELMMSAEGFGISQAEFSLQAGPILNSGMMPNKAAWLEVFSTGDLSFPLDAELVAQIPRWIPGKVPSSKKELYADLIRLPASA
jgi:hypothetical protein